MNAILILFANDLPGQAFQPLYDGKNSVTLAVEQAKKFPAVGKTVLLAASGNDFSFLEQAQSGQIEIEQRESWTKQSLLDTMARLQAGYDCAYFAFADCPFLDPALAAPMIERHLRYAAEYSYADGFPFGLAPEILSAGTAAILAKINANDEGKVERDILFSVIQKDINAFDIETEISKIDLRCHRLNLCADSKRNLLLLKNMTAACGQKLPDASDIERIIEEQPQMLRTLPNFYPIQVSGGCPQTCALCPYPSYTDAQSRRDFMPADKFEHLLDKIIAFCGDAVIDLSLWGELSLHPDKLKLIEKVLSKKEFSLVIETSGLGWKKEELETCAELSRNAVAKINRMPPLSWIVSLDTTDPKIYTQLRSGGFAEANDCAKTLLSLFQKDCYVQAVRTSGAEDDVEKFYRYWKENAPHGEKNIIIQKYDDFCGSMEKKQASDISPVIRQPCWHIMRDVPILIDGTVPLCKEDHEILKDKTGERKGVLGNVFNDPLDTIWENGQPYYGEHCKKNYAGLCSNCDEYYTYNF